MGHCLRLESGGRAKQSDLPGFLLVIALSWVLEEAEKVQCAQGQCGTEGGSQPLGLLLLRGYRDLCAPLAPVWLFRLLQTPLSEGDQGERHHRKLWQEGPQAQGSCPGGLSLCQPLCMAVQLGRYFSSQPRVMPTETAAGTQTLLGQRPGRGYPQFWSVLDSSPVAT